MHVEKIFFLVNLQTFAKNLNNNQKNLTKNKLFNRYCLNSSDYCPNFTGMASRENRFY